MWGQEVGGLNSRVGHPKWLPRGQAHELSPGGRALRKAKALQAAARALVTGWRLIPIPFPSPSREIMFHDPLQTAGDESAPLSQPCTPLPLPTLSCLRRAPASHRYQVKAAVKLQGGQVTHCCPQESPSGQAQAPVFHWVLVASCKTGGTVQDICASVNHPER